MIKNVREKSGLQVINIWVELVDQKHRILMRLQSQIKTIKIKTGKRILVIT